MDASIARERTETVIREREIQAAADAEEKRRTYEEKIDMMAAEMRREVELIIDQAVADGAFQTEYSWESRVSNDPLRQQQEFNEQEDRHAAYITMCNGLEAEGFSLQYGSMNLNGFEDQPKDEAHRYTIRISWEAPVEKKNIFQRIGSRVVRSWRNFNDVDGWA